THHSKQKAASSPTDHHDERGHSAPLVHIAVCSQQFLQGRLARQHKNALAHAVEEPSCRRQDEHHPMIHSDPFKSAALFFWGNCRFGLHKECFCSILSNP